MAVSRGQGGRLAGDVHRHVADPLQVVVDLQGRNQLPQVDRHRLVQGQRLEAFLLEVDLAAIDVFVHRLHFPGKFRVAVEQGADRLLDLLLDDRADQEQISLRVCRFLAAGGSTCVLLVSGAGVWPACRDSIRNGR